MSDQNKNKKEGGVAVEERTQTKRPSMYKVLLHNDDYTPMDFVVHILENIFQKSTQEATEIMLKVHQEGYGVAGIYTYEIAESKSHKVYQLARKNEHPLRVSIEKE